MPRSRRPSHPSLPPHHNTTASGGNKVAQEYRAATASLGVEHTSGQTKDAEQCSSGNVVAKAERTSARPRSQISGNDVAKAERTSGRRGTAEECNGGGAKRIPPRSGQGP
eukprot:gene10856-16970_t